MSLTEPRYCIAGLYRSGASKPTPISANDRIIVFDTLAQAQDVLPLLGNGRIASWSEDGETVFFAPIDPEGVNRIAILTGYDPYDLPPNMPAGILSEAHGRPWRYHVHYAHWMFDCGQMVKRGDGTYANTALGEEVY